MFHSGRVAALVIIALAAFRKPAAQSPAPGSDPERIGTTASDPSPSTLTLSSGGGFSGMYRGFTLVFPDSVAAWRQRAAGPREKEWTRKAAPESLAAFSRELEAYAGVELDRKGNMTAGIEYDLGGKKYSWSIAGTPGSPGAPEPFRTWYPRVAAYCRGLEPGP